MENYYDLLDVAPDATPEAIDAARIQREDAAGQQRPRSSQ
jgi:hypothetical protein